MGRFEGKKGLIMGVANGHSIAAGVAKALAKEGAKLCFSHLPDIDDKGKMERRVRQVVDDLDPLFLAPCDVSQDQDLAAFFGRLKAEVGSLDFVVHSIAFAPLDDIRCQTYQVSRSGFAKAFDISVYSFLAVAHHAKALLNPDASLLTMTYFGGEKVIPGYNLMGLCKASLDMAVRYLAYELGADGIRVNAISAGPIKTLASSAVGDFKELSKGAAAISPLRRAVDIEDVGYSALSLLDPRAKGITGEILHVDSGFHIMGAGLA